MSSTFERIPVLNATLQSVTESDEFRGILEQINRGARVISISGLVAAPARALALVALQLKSEKTFALVVPAQRDLESWERDISFWYCALRGVSECGEAVAVLPAAESDPYAGGSPHADTLERRALALWRLAHRPQDFVLLTSRALARRTVLPSDILAAGAALSRNEDVAPEDLIDKLVAGGYVREDPI